MSATKPSKLKPAQLRDAFIADLASCWQYARSLHPKDTPYAYVLFGLEGTPHLYPHVLTEEGLDQAAKRYIANGDYENVGEGRKELRFSIEDSPYATELEGRLPIVDALLEPIEHTLDESEGYALLAKAAMDGFVALDKQGTFGTGKLREKLLLMIDTSFAEKDWSLASVKQLNPQTALKHYLAQTKIEGVYASCDTLTFSPDGRSLYFAGGREIDPRKEKSISEVVACDIAGLRLKRRWSFSFPRFGDSGKAVACTRDGSDILVLRTRVADGADQTMLMRFGRDRNKLLQNLTLAGGASDFTLSHDDSRVVLSMYDKTIRVLDQNLGAPKVIKLKSTPYCIKPLKSGGLLVGTDAGVIRIDQNLKPMPTSYTDEAVTISIDASERLMAVSRYFCIFGSERKKNAEFGFQMVSLPKLKILCSILIPSHQLIGATLSPNGRFVAFEAHEVGKPRKFIVVYETATFREIARRESDFVRDIVFSPDSKMLAFTRSGYTSSEPVILWRFANI